jgi:hypothetical protein
MLTVWQSTRQKLDTACPFLFSRSGVRVTPGALFFFPQENQMVRADLHPFLISIPFLGFHGRESVELQSKSLKVCTIQHNNGHLDGQLVCALDSPVLPA